MLVDERNEKNRQACTKDLVTCTINASLKHPS